MSGRLLKYSTMALIFTITCSVQAHTRSDSFSYWWVTEDRAAMSFTASARDTTKLYQTHSQDWSLDRVLREHLRDRVVLSAEGKTCSSQGDPIALAANDGYLKVEWSFDCKGQTPDELAIDGFFDAFPNHIHFIQFATPGGATREYVITATSNPVKINLHERDSFGSVLWRYLELGLAHILSGVDHMVFLLALLLLCSRLQELVLLVTGFTVGHGLSLSLATFGLLQPDVITIEALIAFTIALVALEGISQISGRTQYLANAVAAGILSLVVVRLIWDQGLPIVTLLGVALLAWSHLSLTADVELASRWRPYITAMFGLIHGFGFANALVEIGLPRGDFLVALLGFNVGVEIGQLFVVTLMWIAISYWRLRMGRKWLTQSQEMVSVGLFACGVFWFVERAYGT